MLRDDAISMRKAALGGGFRMGVVAAIRRRSEWLLPVALLALLLQIAAPIAASWFTAAALADPLAIAEICHSDPDAAPADQGHDRNACAVDCLICCVSHAGGVLDAPQAPTLSVPRPTISRIAWLGHSLVITRVRAGSNAQARAPPSFS